MTKLEEFHASIRGARSENVWLLNCDLIYRDSPLSHVSVHKTADSAQARLLDLLAPHGFDADRPQIIYWTVGNGDIPGWPEAEGHVELDAGWQAKFIVRRLELEDGGMP